MIFYVHHALRESTATPSQNDNIKNVGKEDAEIVAQLFLDAKLRGINISAIYTSPYYRCKETANIINKHINVPMFEDERLNEFVGERGVKKYGLPQQAAETWTACQTRVIACLKDIVNTYKTTK